MEFEGKVAIATGAASGMGLLLCQCYAEKGGNVVMADINQALLEEKVAEINAKSGGRAVAAVCDVRDYQQVCAVRDLAVQEFGRIDLMVNTAGGAETRILHDQIPEGCHEFPDIPIEIYDWSLDVNLRGQFYFDHAVSQQMKKQKSGVIINIGSITGEEGSGAAVGYATSKSAAMNGLTKSVAAFGANYGIRCVCVAPGPVLTRAAMANMKTALGRAAEPQEIVDLMLYLASDKAAFITGTNILIDGGRNLLQS